MFFKYSFTLQYKKQKTKIKQNQKLEKQKLKNIKNNNKKKPKKNPAKQNKQMNPIVIIKLNVDRNKYYIFEQCFDNT